MQIPLEEHLPYRLLALVVLVIFYTIYLLKMWAQKRQGICTQQINRQKEPSIHRVEICMSIATVGIIPAQLLSIAFGWSHLPDNARFTGFCLGMLGGSDLSDLRSVHAEQLARRNPGQRQDRACHNRHLPFQPQSGIPGV